MPGAAASAKVALVSGATGITGGHLVELLQQSSEWAAIHTISRSQQGPESSKASKVVHHRADLLKGPQEVARALQAAGVADITHVFHCAYLPTESPAKDCEANLGMLKALVEGAEGAGAALQHVFCMSGTKYYGVHFKPGGIDALKTPHKEDHPRHLPPNFYYDQEDYLIQRVEGGAPWSWSTLRPNPVIGLSSGSAMNLAVSVGVYGSVCKELGLPFRFPGTAAGYSVLTEMCDASLLAEAMVFTSTKPQCANQAYNISNGDTFRWNQLWPKLASFFGLPVAEPPMCLSLAEMMGDKAGVWERMVKKHSLQGPPYDRLATWPFLDIVLSQRTDNFSDVGKLRRAGFSGMCLESSQVLLRQLERLREERVIP